MNHRLLTIASRHCLRQRGLGAVSTLRCERQSRDVRSLLLVVGAGCRSWRDQVRLQPLPPLLPRGWKRPREAKTCKSKRALQLWRPGRSPLAPRAPVRTSMPWRRLQTPSALRARAPPQVPRAERVARVRTRARRAPPRIVRHPRAPRSSSLAAPEAAVMPCKAARSTLPRPLSVRGLAWDMPASPMRRTPATSRHHMAPGQPDDGQFARQPVLWLPQRQSPCDPSSLPIQLTDCMHSTCENEVYDSGTWCMCSHGTLHAHISA